MQGIHHNRHIAILERFLKSDCSGPMGTTLAFLRVYTAGGRRHFSIFFSKKVPECRLVQGRRRLSAMLLEELRLNPLTNTVMWALTGTTAVALTTMAMIMGMTKAKAG